ncbi:MAG TPA: glycoside hydrolase family 98 domain-containing protein [Candidatus Paceibacterota bacterium]|nr:glycoside hydrolase family 98 domain-containing protein [Candidatus Paceibacterota bacterium]
MKNPLNFPLILSFIFQIAAFEASAESLKVDFNGSSAQTMSGYQAYTAQNEVAGSFGSRSYSAFGTTVVVTPTWAGSPATNTAQQAQVRASNGYSTNAADLLDLLIDWIGTDGRETPGDPMTLTISGLPTGTYGWLSYHHDTQDQQGVFSVTVNDAAGSATTSGLQISHTQGTSNTNLASVSKFSTAITSDGVNPVSLVFDSTSSTNSVSTAFFVMNGFQLTNSVVVAPPQTNAALRRPLSPNSPLLVVHIDTWNAADPQKIIDLIPPDIRPYVVMNISLSISHNNNTDPGRYNVVEYGYETAKSWVRTCAQNRMWVMIQPSSGGFSHLSDFDLSVYHEFFQSYPNFLGFNYTEQFWGFDLADDNPPDLLSTFWVDRINHFANLLQVCNQYGGYLIVSWCGNQWSPTINPIGMLKRNPAFAAACRKYTENFILCDKFTQGGYQCDMQSLCLGAYVSGYAGNWGIRYDETGWTDGSRTHTNFTMASAGPPYVDHIMDGATVIDGPELIWQQDFRELSAGSADSGFTMRRWDRYPQFDNVTIDFFRKLVDGTVRIPTRQEVIDRAKVVVVNDVNSGTIDDIYSTPETLFEGLYRMDGDGNLRDNLTLHKKSGRYPTIPVVYALDDALANSFQVKVSKSAYSTRWPSLTAKTNEFNSLFPQEYTGDICARRLENQWIVYNPYKFIGQSASANIPFKYNTCDSMDLTFSEYTAGVFTEISNKVTFYLGNYDNAVNTALKTDTITIYSATAEPTYSWADRASHQASNVSKSWSGGVFTLTVQHNGPLDLTVNCAGSAAGRLTAFTAPSLVTPALPAAYPGLRQYEGECFDYKNVTAVSKNGYSGILRNYTGQGYVQFGAGSTAAVRDSVTVLNGGTYRLETKYSVTGADIGTIDLYVNGVKVATPLFTDTADNTAWAVNKQFITLNAGVNTIEYRANGTGASPIYFDNFVVVPTAVTGGIIVQENKTGFMGVDGAIENANSGYTGDGYAKATNAIGDGINWNLNFDASVIKAFTFRYAGTNSGMADLVIGGVSVASKIQFPATGSLTNWENVMVYAYTPAGNFAVKLQSTSAAGLPNIDYLEVTGGWAGTQPPSGLVATALSKSVINLSWIAASNATSYTVKRGLTSGGPYSVVASGITSTSYNNFGLSADTTYYYVVSATSGVVEGSDSGEVSATTSSGAVTPVGSSSGLYSVTSGSGVTVGTFDLDDRANALVVGVYIDANNIACLTNLTSFGGVPPTGFIQASGAGDREFALYWINPKTAAGQSLVIAANASANIGAGYFSLQLSGVDTNAPVIKTGNTTTSASSVNLTTTAANSFIASFYSANESGLTLTPASPLAAVSTTLNNINGVGGGGSLSAATYVKAAPGTQNLSWSSSGTTANQGVNGLAFAPLSPDGPPSGPAILTNSYTAGVLRLSWPAGEAWRLQMQTNSLSTGLGTNWVYVTGSTVSSTNIPINPTSGAVFFRLVYP